MVPHKLAQERISVTSPPSESPLSLIARAQLALTMIRNVTALLVAAMILLAANASPNPKLKHVAKQGVKGTDCPIHSVCFAMDQSTSISSDDYVVEQQFVVDTAQEIASRTKDTTYSAYGFSTSVRVIQSGTKDLKGVFIPAVIGAPKKNGGTNMYGGLSACFDEVKNDKGNRLIVLITDGRDNKTPMADVIAPDVKKAGVSIVTVGVGSQIEEDYLKGLATAPDFFVESDSFNELPTKVLSAVENSCAVVVVSPEPSVSPTAKPPSTPTPSPDASVSCADAYQSCDFAFKGEATVPTFSVTGESDVPFTPLIVSRKKKETLGVLNSNGIVPEFIFPDGSVLPINSRILPTPLSPTQFKPYSITGTNGSGVGHETYQTGQESVARRKCIRVWFSGYQLLRGKRANVVENVHVGKSANKCVVFRSA